jgi:ribonuclease D
VLSAAQVQYAALDALVLIPLRERLERDAIDNGWTAEVDAAAERSLAEALRFS